MKIGVIGCAGRMGQMLVRTAAVTEGCRLAGGTERSGSPALGQDVGAVAGLQPVGVPVSDDPVALFEACDGVLEFTTPSATVRHASIAAESGRVHVIGTTGFTEEQSAQLRSFASRAAIVWAPNMSLGVNLLTSLVRRVARALDPDWDIEVLEMHHRMKVDAPSGTALALGAAAAEGRSANLTEVWRRTRDGMTGARPRGEIGFATLRGGDVVGEHTVVFAADGERIELKHVATSRAIYARGAVKAALWAQDKAPGLYSMQDVLGLGT